MYAECCETDYDKEPLRIIEGAESLPHVNKIRVHLNCGHSVLWDRPPVDRVAIDISRMTHCPTCADRLGHTGGE
jgi:hypothetical protein